MKRVICANNENIRDFNDINILALEDTMVFIIHTKNVWAWSQKRRNRAQGCVDPWCGPDI
jgi:hypothetical protein